jgi:hypothetical protein
MGYWSTKSIINHYVADSVEGPFELVDLESVNVVTHAYYQGLLNADGTMNYTFSIPRSSTDLNTTWRVRMISDIATGATYAEWASQYGLELYRTSMRAP